MIHVHLSVDDNYSLASAHNHVLRLPLCQPDLRYIMFSLHTVTMLFIVSGASGVGIHNSKWQGWGAEIRNIEWVVRILDFLNIEMWCVSVDSGVLTLKFIFLN